MIEYTLTFIDFFKVLKSLRWVYRITNFNDFHGITKSIKFMVYWITTFKDSIKVMVYSIKTLKKIYKNYSVFD